MTPTPSSPSHHWLIEKYLTVLTFQLPLHSYLSVALSPPIVLLSPLSQGTPQRCRPVLVSGHFTIQNLGNGLGFVNNVWWRSSADQWSSLQAAWSTLIPASDQQVVSLLISTNLALITLNDAALIERHLDHPDCRGARVPCLLIISFLLSL